MKASLLGLVVFLVSSKAFCWGDVGHQTVGELAQRNLTPEARQKIEEIMGAEILQASAIWPDIVRSDSRHRPFADFHFIDVPAGIKYSDIKETEKRPRNAEVVIRKFGAILKDKKKTRDEKMIAIRYLVHVIGDVHQPLHVGNSYDMGANTCVINLKMPHLKEEKLLNLHSLWDEEIIEFIKEDVRQKEIAEAKRKKADAPQKRFFGASNFADMIVTKHKDILSERSVVEAFDPSVWLQEAADLRNESVYPDRNAKLKAPVDEAIRKYCINVKDPTQKGKKIDPVKLDHRYLSEKVNVVERQIYKAGLRLAHFLNALAKEEHFTSFAESPTSSTECVLKAAITREDCDRKTVEEKGDFKLEVSPAEQALATVLEAVHSEKQKSDADKCGSKAGDNPVCRDCDFKRNLYLSRKAAECIKK